MIDKYCKNCKHLKEDSVMENNLLIGVALGTFFWPQYKDTTVCKNTLSTYYGDEKNNYDSCYKFEPK